MSDGGTPRRLYDPFDDRRLDPERWTVREAKSADGSAWQYMDPGATVQTGDGELAIGAERFRRGHDRVQAFDNAKVLILSEPPVRVPPSGALTVEVEMTATKHGGGEADLRDGFAALNVVDLDTGMVFDLATNGARTGAIYERLPIGSWEPFLHFIDSPFQCPPIPENGWQHFAIEIDSAAAAVRWLVGGTCIFSVAGLPAVPASVRFGPGLLTLLAIGPKGSVSAHGQGITAKWRHFQVAASHS